MEFDIEDQWKIVDIHASNVSVTFLTALQAVTSDYLDHSGNPGVAENIYKAGREYDKDFLEKLFKHGKDLETFQHIEKLCVKYDAFYFRIIT